MIETTEAMIPTCKCGACRSSNGSISGGFGYSGGAFRPNVQFAVDMWEHAMRCWLDSSPITCDHYARQVNYWHEQLLDYGVDHHSILGCSMTTEEADQCRAKWDERAKT